MKNFFKVFAFSLLGGVLTGIVRYIVYEMNKGVIEFDGPALLSFWISIIGGMILFGIISVVLLAKKKV